MGRYWYFASTLPAFQFGVAPPLSESDFMQACAYNLSPEDLKEIARIPAVFTEKASPEGFRSDFMKAFVAWERGFRNELAILRAKELGMDPGRWLREARIETSQTQAAASCFAARDPLEAEISLERERWNTVQRLSSLHAFDLDTIAAYMLMLQISARIASFDRERGAAGYGRLYSDILGPAGTGGAETKPSGVQA